MLNSDMTLARLMTHAQQVEEQKVRTRERQNKRARLGSFSFAQPKLEGGNHSQFYPKSSALVIHPLVSKLLSLPVPQC